MWVAFQTTQKSLPQIGAAMRRHHTTVMHGVRHIEKLRAEGDKKIIEWSDNAMHKVLADPRQVEFAV